MSIKLSAGQQVALAVAFTDAKGNPASLTSVPVWAVSGTDIVTLDAQSEDGLNVTLKPVGALGETLVTATVDGITVSLDVAVVGGVAVGGSIVAGVVEEQPVVEPVVEPAATAEAGAEAVPVQ